MDRRREAAWFRQKRGRLPWVAPANVWERIVLHVVIREMARNRAMILVAYGRLKRSMYGRASIELLKRRLVLAS